MSSSRPLVISMTLQKPELVIPATATPRERKHLSDIDDQGSLRFQVPILMFYKYSPSMEGKDPAKVIKEGLSKTLVFYYPFAGRIIELMPDRKLVVDCNGEGILFVEADAQVELDKLGDSIKPPCPYLDQLLYNVPGSAAIIGCPLLLVQVTRFSCGGFAVGFRLNHTMTDAYGIKLFLNALTELIQGASTPTILPVWQRHLLSARSSPCITCTHHEFDDHKSNNINAWDQDYTNLIQHSFFFGNKEMEAIQDQVSPNQRAIYTKFELLVAFLWKCRTIALGLHPEEIVHLTYLVNVRGKSLKFELPFGYYGNAWVSPAAVSKAGLLCSSPLTYAVDLVKNVKDQMNEEYVRSVADLMVIKGRPELTKSWNFIISDNRSAGFDEVDFGWGVPIFGGVPKAISVISFCLPLKNNMGEKGILIAISLPPLAMRKFQEIVQDTCNDPKFQPVMMTPNIPARRAKI
ncbi:PREDICTED: methanol O-anthraniloyltransferase-like [Nicotiana attenuata]|uniref:Methanol o-anthraniloyltransferase n=1 Tax=Nicotiana attenuata TaxID=49451 RepID=A0A314KQB1_NICAT|nr:PREDICTED: methanol O-anthraniloyltransferase-like [Nicotiana attenuata]OIT31453.1 methanol o-anthraniloyltransferase [Nicotiana attenuata]